MFVTVARLGEIPPGTGRQVTVGERWVGLFNLDGQYHAIDNVCLHRGGPLCEGPIVPAVRLRRNRGFFRIVLLTFARAL
jgi:nitrite reductase/ring-hydroxylating ferredoxin subunit